MPTFPFKHGNISFPPVKLTSAVVTCLVLSPFWRPYWCKIRTVGRSRRHLVDFVTIAGEAVPPRFSGIIAKERSCCLHLCSISLRVCPTSSNIDPSGSLMCPKSLPSTKNTRTSVFPQRNSCLPNGTVAGCHPEEAQKSHIAAPLVLTEQHFSLSKSHLGAQRCPS